MTGNEKDLFEKLRLGDEIAFKVIYHKYVPRLYHFVYEYIPHNDIVENIIQDTLMTLWDKRQKLAENTNLMAYLFTIAKNNCLYKLREQRYRRKLFESAAIGEIELKVNIDALNTLDTSIISFKEIETIIMETINQLSPQCKLVFLRSRFENKKNHEIATELGISVKAVEAHITRALKVFRVALRDYLPLITFLLAN